jgi:hypothetical protein
MILALGLLLGSQEDAEVASARSVLERLASPDEGVQEKAVEDLKGLKAGPRVGALLLRAAARDYPNENGPWLREIHEDLLRPLWDGGRAEWLPVVEEVYDRLEARGEGREYALRILTEMRTEASLGLLHRLLLRPSSRTVDLHLVFVPIKPSAETAKRLFPRLFEAVPNLYEGGPLFNLILDFVRAGHLDLGAHAAFGGTLVERARGVAGRRGEDFIRFARVLDRIDPAPEAGGPPGEVEADFFELEVLADLLGYVKGEGASGALREVLGLRPERLRAYAAASLLARGEGVGAGLLDGLAAGPSGRAVLWEALEGSGELDAFPAKYRSQRRLAEADMVRWLQFPTEFGCAPEELERLAVVRGADGEGAIGIYYFFKFRHPAHDGGKWLVGVAGPYGEKGPARLAGSATFSQFTPLGDKDLNGHIREYLGKDVPYNVLER